MNNNSVVDSIENARFRVAETEWNVIRSGDGAKHLAEADYRSVIEAWMDAGEVHRARTVYDSCPYTSTEIHLLEWEILDAEESIALGESIYPSGLPMKERWVIPSFIPNREQVGRWLAGRILNADDPSRPTVIWTPGKDLKSARVLLYDFKDGEFEAEIEVVPPMKIVENEFFFIAQYGSLVRMFPIICDEAPWNTGRRAEKRRVQMEELKSWGTDRCISIVSK